MKAAKFPICHECINREFDPFQCKACDGKSHFESIASNENDDDDAEDLTFVEFVNYFRGK